jgi:hypothetical protein
MSSVLRKGRPVYRLAAGVAAPRLETVTSSLGQVIPQELHAFRRAPESVLRLRVASWMENPLAQETRSVALDRNDRDQINALASAALTDIADLSLLQTREWIEDPIDSPRRRELMAGADPDRGDTRSTVRRNTRGRQLWARVGAWPWWAIADAGFKFDGRLPQRWWEIDRIAETFSCWLRTG